MLVLFVIIAAFVGFIPGGHFILIPMELFLVYSTSKKYGAFDLVPFIAMSGVLILATGFIGGLATFLQIIPIIGQLANSIVAAGVMWIIGSLAEEHYSKR